MPKSFEHHWTVYNANSLDGITFPAASNKPGSGDVTKPTITSFSIQPQVIHTDKGDRKIEIEIGTSDDWSGVVARPEDPIGEVDFWLTPPDWPISWGMSGSSPKLSGTYLDGTWHLNR